VSALPGNIQETQLGLAVDIVHFVRVFLCVVCSSKSGPGLTLSALLLFQHCVLSCSVPALSLSFSFSVFSNGIVLLFDWQAIAAATID